MSRIQPAIAFCLKCSSTAKLRVFVFLETNIFSAVESFKHNFPVSFCSLRKVKLQKTLWCNLYVSASSSWCLHQQAMRFSFLLCLLPQEREKLSKKTLERNNLIFEMQLDQSNWRSINLNTKQNEFHVDFSSYKHRFATKTTINERRLEPLIKRHRLFQTIRQTFRINFA